MLSKRSKRINEVRDPIHNFIHFNSDERNAIDSTPFQRLRHIHQLALTYLVYPGATHKRFEHSLGVMELASRVYDVITDQNNLQDSVRDILPNNPDYWRQVLRMAALFHDVGHLPFSHAAEKELLPNGWNHEKLTAKIILSKQMKEKWDKIGVNPKHVARIAVGQRNYEDLSDWEFILSEIITGDALGVDRMDYLLRDSYHTGVAYGKFDHYRLIDTIRILTPEYSNEPMLGIESGGLHSAEALLLARYFMFSQVYCHSIRRIYDIHLRDFLETSLPNGKFPVDLEHFLQQNDSTIFVELFNAANNKKHLGHEHAKRIIDRNHFKLLYGRQQDDIPTDSKSWVDLNNEMVEKYKPENVRYDSYTQSREDYDFPVRDGNGSISSARLISNVLKTLPITAIDFIFINPKKLL